MKSYLTAVSAIALSVGLVACVEVPKPQYPVRAEPAAAPAPAATPVHAAPAPAPAADGAPQAKPTTSVEQSTLAPPPGAKVAPAPKKKPGAALDRYPGDGRATLVLAAYSADQTVFEAAKKKAKRVSKAAAEDSSSDTVTVGKGDTLASIAKKHGTTVDALASLNGLKSPYRLTAGKTLKLAAAPASDAAPAKTTKGKASSGKAAETPEQVTVAKGDTLASIAKKSGVSVADLASINGLKKPYKLKLGQKLELAAAASDSAPQTEAPKSKKGTAKVEAGEPAAESATSTITVRRKDTIQSLARDAKVSVAELARLNHLKKPYRLKPGQKIKVPDQPGFALEREISSSAPKRATVVIAGRKDTLQSIARKEGLRVDELARLNGIKKPYHIKRGQKIKLPVRSDVPASTASSSAKTYQVQSGDTLYSIARRFGTDAKTLADLNGMDAGQALKSGRRIHLPGAAAEEQAAPKPSREAPREAPPAPPTSGRQPSQPVPYSSLPNPATPPAPGQTTAPNPRIPPVVAPPPYRPPPPPAESTTPADADVAEAGKGLFQWPVKGQTLQAFGPIANGQRNDGLDIGAGQGSPVAAAAAGEVVYAGSSVPTFGNMVLIRHDGGWVTVYAHLANIDVKMRQTVTQGQQIGEVGTSGGVSQPQVHFEVRYNPSAKDKPRPIDPALVLPQ